MCGRGSKASRLQHDAVGAQRPSDVLQILLAHIGDGDLELAADLLVGGSRETDPPGLGDALQTRSDIDTVAEDVIALCEDVADMETDAEFDPPLRPIGGSRHAALHRDGAADRIERAGKLDQQAVARDMDDAAAM